MAGVRMRMKNNQHNTTEIFETMPIGQALAAMAIPTIISQLITLFYNMADTWFIGQTGNPYMVAASSLVATIYLMTSAISNLFGTGGGSLMVRLLGSKDMEEARRVASCSLVLAGMGAVSFSILCFIFMDPLLRLLGASDQIIGYARQYMFFVVVLGGIPNVLSNTMSTMVRNSGYSREAGFGLGMGGVLNVILDPIFMFVLMPDGYEVAGAALATLVSSLIVLTYFVRIYRKLQAKTILELPRKLEMIEKTSVSSMFSVGIPAALSLFLYDLTNIVINRLSSAHGDLHLAAIGIVLKVERLPLNTGVGICLGMAPLVAYNYASGNHKRMKGFFAAGRMAGLVVAGICIVLYWLGAPYIMHAFIADEATVALGTEFMRARCFAPPFMFLSFHMVHFMQSINRGRYSFYMAVIRQLCLNIPILLLTNWLFGMAGIIWTQVIADITNVVISYLIYRHVMRQIAGTGR